MKIQKLSKEKYIEEIRNCSLYTTEDGSDDSLQTNNCALIPAGCYGGIKIPGMEI